CWIGEWWATIYPTRKIGIIAIKKEINAKDAKDAKDAMLKSKRLLRYKLAFKLSVIKNGFQQHRLIKSVQPKVRKAKSGHNLSNRRSISF
ncbi:MAG TPA: hypothetical protein DCM38_10680, partial [Gammaproteobacteria bacterium]|nr:hypothetical protein [Gammaproteobacteria bacterium]